MFIVGVGCTCAFGYVLICNRCVYMTVRIVIGPCDWTLRLDMCWVAIDVLHDCSHCDWTLCSMDLVIYIPGRRNEDIRFQQDPMSVFRARVHGVVFLKACHQVSKYMKLYRRLGGIWPLYLACCKKRVLLCRALIVRSFGKGSKGTSPAVRA